MKKLNRKQKEHIKKVFFKTVNIFCYVCTCILALFLLITCIQSCSTKSPKGVSAEGLNNNTYSYRLRDTGVVAMSEEDFLSYNELFGLTNDNIEEDYTLGTEEYYTYSLPTGSVLYNFTQNINVDIYNIQYTFMVKKVSVHDFRWRLDKLGVLDSNNNYYSLLSHYSDLASDYYLDYAVGDIYILSDIYFNNIKGNSLFMFYEETSTFIFNKIFNFNAPFGISLNMPYSPEPPYETLTTYIEYNMGWFISNGQKFDTIKWNFRNNNSQEFWLWVGGDTGHIVSSHDTVGFTWTSIEYINSVTGNVVVATQRSTNVGEYDGAYVVFYNSGSTWTIDNYRTLFFLTTLSESNRDILLEFNNNNQYGGGIINNSSGDNIFTLIASAFSAWLPIMSMYLLPGITLGTLLFIPLVALLVFAIIRIIKK